VGFGDREAAKARRERREAKAKAGEEKRQNREKIREEKRAARRRSNNEEEGDDDDDEDETESEASDSSSDGDDDDDDEEDKEEVRGYGRNRFGNAFQEVVQETNARVRIDSFEHCVVEVKKEDLAGFLESLSMKAVVG